MNGLPKFIRVLILVFSIVEVKCTATSVDGEYEVIFVNVLYRHGARTPVNTYPNDRHEDAFPEGLGQLTNVGKRQHYALGRWLHQRYDFLLSEKYIPDEIYVMSSDIDRVLMSAQCNLAGMYPPKGDQVWNEDLDWQPIPIHTIPTKMDEVVEEKVPCPAYDNELKKVIESEEVKAEMQKYDYIIDILNEFTGENRHDIKYISSIFDILLVQKQNDLDLPEWTNNIFPHPMEEEKILKYKIATWNKKLARLHVGLLLKEMLKNIQNKIAKKSPRNMHVYAAHDTTIANLLHALDLYDSKLVPYAATVMMELAVSATGDYFVMLFYRYRRTQKEPQLLTIPGCSAACPLDDFIALTKEVIPGDWEAECQKNE